jgi:diaminopimelate epimerase
MKMYIVNYTSNMQTYNIHWVFAIEEDAKAKALEVIEAVKQYETIQEVYTDIFYELYCEIQDQTIRVYIYEAEV